MTEEKNEKIEKIFNQRIDVKYTCYNCKRDILFGEYVYFDKEGHSICRECKEKEDNARREKI